MKKALLHISCICAFLACFACAPVYYTPNTHNVPMLEKQGDFRFAAMLESRDMKAAQVQASYALTDNAAIILDGYNHFTIEDDSGNGGSGNFLEAGAGYRTLLSPKKDIVFELYGLAGIGSVENHFPAPQTSDVSPGNIKAKMFKLGVQPSIGYKLPYVEMAAALQLASLTYFDVSGDLLYLGMSEKRYLEERSTMFLAEPSLTLRGGLPNLKLQLQYVHSINITHSTFRQEESSFSVGVVYMLGE